MRKSIAESTAEDFDLEVGLNVRSAIAHAQAALPPMLRARRGVIINIGSVAAMLPVPNASLYSPAKAALLMYTRTLASEVGRHGVRVNCVSPGPVDTRIFGKMLGTSATDFKEELRKRVPLLQLGAPEDVAGAVAFLASDESSWITGANLVIDGGRTAYCTIAEVFHSAV